MSDPIVISLSPASGPAGTVVTVAGTGLSPLSGASLGGVALAISGLSDTAFTFTVPSLGAGGAGLTLHWAGSLSMPGGMAVTSGGGNGGGGPTPPGDNTPLILAGVAGGAILLAVVLYRGKK